MLWDEPSNCYRPCYSVNHIGSLNPFRYRGYYFDEETGLYYLQSRYYDAEVGRFVNADDTSTIIAQSNILSTNLYSYCFNNVVNCLDDSGYIVTPANIIGALIGTVGGSLIGSAIADYFGLTGWAKWACTAGTSLLLGVVGWFAGPVIFEALKTIIINLISAGTILLNQISDWIAKTFNIVERFAERAINNVSDFYVSQKHLLGAGGNYSQFLTDDMDVIRRWITTALRNGTNFITNSSDSYSLIYNLGEIIGTNGEQSIKVVFSVAGKIITAYPIK